MRSPLYVALIFTGMTTLTTLICYTMFLGATSLWQILFAYAASTFVATLLLWQPVRLRDHTSRFGGAWIGLLITMATLVGFSIIRFIARGDFGALIDWKTFGASLIVTFGYVGWVLTIINIILGFALANTKPRRSSYPTFR